VVYGKINFTFAGVPLTNQYRTVGIIKQPLTNNVSLTVASSQPRKFTVGESIIQYRVGSSLDSVSINGSTITGTGFNDKLVVGQYVAVSLGLSLIIGKVTVVTNNTTATISTSFAGTFTGTGNLVTPTAFGVVKQTTSTELILDRVSAPVEAMKLIYGASSFASDTISSVNINGTGAANFDNVRQTSRITGAIIGTFQQDEIVRPVSDTSSSSPSAIVHSTGSGVVFITNEYRQLPLTQLVGMSSGATIAPTAKYSGNFATDGGEILYVKHILPITKAAGKATEVRVVFDF
jgi:hypothetical protein